MRLRMGQVFMGQLDVGVCTGLVVGDDQLGHFFVRFGCQFQVLSGFGVVLLRLEQSDRWCRGHGSFGFEGHGTCFQ